MLPTGVDVEQPIELVQISADTRTKLDLKHSTARSKLTGLQFHHFGAFYKSSWRANDWMWGRLDGAGWLVHLLLDPRRILVLAESSGQAMGARVQWFLEKLHEQFPALVPETDAIRAELAYLDDETRPMPLSLPETSMWVAAMWQRHIAVAELPVVAREIVANPTLRTNDWAVDVLIKAKSAKSVVAAAQGAAAAVTTGHWTKEQKKLQEWALANPMPELTGADQDELVAMLPAARCPTRSSPTSSASPCSRAR